ncbi:MAG: hypothetical protein EP343_23065 [Deltaproteobacteria bacterium]|nr:MAG: hypothetical protein EP343_23065 [Deltaproteobacteria bacterium]
MDAPSTGRLTGSLLESGSGIYLQLPTFEIRRYLATGHSIDFQLPIGDLLLAALVHPASGLPALPLGLGIHYTLFFPQKNFRWFVGPGAWLNAGIQFAGPVSVALGFQPGVQLGVEWQTGDVGVMLRVRPYATLGAAIAHGGISELLGVGASVEFAILHYR